MEYFIGLICLRMCFRDVCWDMEDVLLTFTLFGLVVDMFL